MYFMEFLKHSSIKKRHGGHVSVVTFKGLKTQNYYYLICISQAEAVLKDLPI